MVKRLAKEENIKKIQEEEKKKEIEEKLKKQNAKQIEDEQKEEREKKEKEEKMKQSKEEKERKEKEEKVIKEKEEIEEIEKKSIAEKEKKIIQEESNKKKPKTKKEKKVDSGKVQKQLEEKSSSKVQEKEFKDVEKTMETKIVKTKGISMLESDTYEEKQTKTTKGGINERLNQPDVSKSRVTEVYESKSSDYRSIKPADSRDGSALSQRLSEKPRYEYGSDRFSPSSDSRARNISGESNYKDTIEKSMQTSNNLMSIVTGSLVPKAENSRPKPPAPKNESKPKKPSEVKKQSRMKQEAAKITPPGGVSDIMIKEVGSNWVSLCWKKPAPTRGSPVLTYKVESWLCGEGAFWVEIGRTPIPQFDVFNLKPNKCYHFRVTARNKRGWGDAMMTTHKVDLSRPTQMPSISSEHDPVVKTFVGSDLKLTLQVSGEPRPTIRWTKNSEDIEDLEGYNVYDDDMGCHVEISSISSDYSGKYTLTAINLAGRATKSIMVQVLSDQKIYEAYKQFKR